MDHIKKACARWLAVVGCLLFFAVSVRSQTQPPAAARPEYHVSPAEARDLLRSLDSILEFDSKDTGLKVRGNIKREFAGREQVQRYFENRIGEDEDAKRLENTSVILKKFGLIPRNFELESFLVSLMKEQVAGYYDPKTQTAYLLDWVPPETQMPVMAHELTHALQDQNFGLEKWSRQPEARHQDAKKQIASDEATAGREAVVEGQAMAVMIDFLLAPTGGSLIKSPAIAEAIEQGMMSSGESPVLSQAPLYIRRLLMFPYQYGLNFTRELLIHRGKQAAYVDVFKKPPESTRQVMEPETYLAGEQLPPLVPPDFNALLRRDYRGFDVGSIGEFDVSVMIEQFAAESGHSGGESSAAVPSDSTPAAGGGSWSGSADSDTPGPQKMPPLWTNWRGGYYYAAQPKHPGKGKTTSRQDATAETSLVFVSRWATPKAASEFAGIYRSSLQKRYTGLASVVPASCHDCNDDSNTPAETLLDSNEGRISVSVQGDTVLAIESFDPASTAKIRKAVLGP